MAKYTSLGLHKGKRMGRVPYSIVLSIRATEAWIPCISSTNICTSKVPHTCRHCKNLHLWAQEAALRAAVMQSRMQKEGRAQGATAATTATAPPATGAQWGAALGPRSAADAVRGYSTAAAAPAAAPPAAAAYRDREPAWGHSRQQAAAGSITDGPEPR